MKYRLKEGVALFRMCGDHYIFPSQRSGISISFLVSVSKELASLIGDQKVFSPENGIDGEMEKKILRLLKLGYIVEESQ